MNKKISKLAAAAMSVAMCLTMFSGCNKENGSPDGTTAPVASEAEPASDIFVNTEWTYGQVSAGGGGFITGVFSTPEDGVYYCRTDVGGSYYRTPETGKWCSMNYWVTSDDKGLLGIDGLAYDPQSPNKVYQLAGTDYFSGGKTCILISHDYGATVEVVDVTDKIKVHGNGMGRGNGERIAVDPNNGDIIFAGGRTGGMIKSTDGGYTWESVDFPVVNTKNTNGINCILFDPATEKDGVTQKIYASVSAKGDEVGNLFVSEDAGKTWNRLANSPVENMIQRMKLDSKGNLYVCYINNEGPWNCAMGALLRYNTDGTVDDISAGNNSYGDIVIHPEDDNKLVLVTSGQWKQQANGAFGDIFFTSTDGGKTWRNVLDSMEMSVNNMPWIEGCAIHWCSSLAMDPFNPNKVMVNSGNGIFSCDNIWDETPMFYFDSYGIEETVPSDIISYEDYPLVSAVYDYDGFVHEDVTVPATRHQDMIGSTTSITIAAQNRDYWAKAGGDDNGTVITVSTDAGKTWKKLTNSPDPSKVLYKGRLAFNADGSVLVWSPENALMAYWSDDLGETWNECSGILGGDIYLVGDPNNANYVYGCGNSKFYVSTDGGKTFKGNPAITPSFRRICVDPQNEGTVYIANGAGLWITKDYGETANFIEGIKYCEAVGLGKAKNDGDPLVIYIWGTPKDKDNPGLYMSEDAGVSWTQVNDDLHHFGGTGNGVFVSGDMNVYGRCYMSTVGLGIIYCDKIEK